MTPRVNRASPDKAREIAHVSTAAALEKWFKPRDEF